MLWNRCGEEGDLRPACLHPQEVSDVTIGDIRPHPARGDGGASLRTGSEEVVALRLTREAVTGEMPMTSCELPFT